MCFATYLRQERVAHNLSRTAFAQRLGISPAHLADLELNRQLPSYAEVNCMAAALGLPPAVLLVHAGYLSQSLLASAAMPSAPR